MQIFQRELEAKILPLMWKGRAILIFGPRQSGKTTLSKKLLERYGDTGKYFSCEHAEVRNSFVEGRPDLLKQLVQDAKIVVFDEAQTILNIGSILKVFIDQYKDIQIIATGSSSFDLANKINEPLTGRAFEFTLLPISLSEIEVNNINGLNILNILKYGNYPAIVAEKDDYVRENLLKNITNNYLYKDIYIFEAIRNPKIFEDLLKLLAEQIGQLVSVNELAKSLSVSRNTIQKYLKLLEQSYIIKTIYSYSKNSRNELKKSFKVFFLDIGIRNAVLARYEDLLNRKDRGFVFENFVFTELYKYFINKNLTPKIFFWRTRQGLEIDFIIEIGERLYAIECKWGDENVIFDKFLKIYPNSTNKVARLKNITNILKDIN